MSAWIVENERFIQLAITSLQVSAQYQKFADPTKEASRIANILVKENYRSVNYRYSENDEAPTLNATPQDFRTTLPIVEAIKLCHCIEYQSCECEDYRQTEAARLLHDILDMLIHSLPGYDEAPWG